LYSVNVINDRAVFEDFKHRLVLAVFCTFYQFGHSWTKIETSIKKHGSTWSTNLLTELYSVV